MWWPDCLQVDDGPCLSDGVEELHYADDDIGWDVCVIDWDVGLRCLDVYIECFDCLHILDEICLIDGAVGLRDEETEVDEVVWVRVDYEVKGNAIFEDVDGTFDVEIKFDVSCVQNEVKKVGDVCLLLDESC